MLFCLKEHYVVLEKIFFYTYIYNINDVIMQTQKCLFLP